MAKPKKPPPKKTGRPTVYRADMCERAVALGRLGMSKAQIAADFGVDRSTIDAWCKEKPGFSGAIARARDAALAWWEHKGMSRLVENHQGPKLNSQVWSRSMAARFPDDYRERQETTHEIGDSLAALIEASMKPDAGG